jgi:shikimate dehydrogenase
MMPPGRMTMPRRLVARSSIWFVGISASASAIHRMFQSWAAILRLDASLLGIDLPATTPASGYRALVARMLTAPGLLGAVVTSHKVRLFEAARDAFQDLSATATVLGEISTVRVGARGLYGDATDPAAIDKTMHRLLDREAFIRSEAEVLCFGSGGSARALALALLAPASGSEHALLPYRAGRPRLHVVGRRQQSLDEFGRVLARVGVDPSAFALHHLEGAEAGDRLLTQLPSGSLIVNATGLGKDAPGSPVGPEAPFPDGSIVWDFNYRGDLRFLVAAADVPAVRGVRVHDGWSYFVHGWAEAFGVLLGEPIDEMTFEMLAAAAEPHRPTMAWGSPAPSGGAAARSADDE